ncbi:MAG: hypothetical protein WC360_02690 [Opitutales bacterium]
MEVRRVQVWRSVLVPLAPDSPITLDRREVIPDPDGMRWVIYAQKAWEKGALRLDHWTFEDNYPDGRYVGWSSPPMWWLESLAYVDHLFTGRSMPICIAEVAPHSNTVLWVLAAATLGALCVLAYGRGGAIILPVLFSVFFNTKYGIFSPDHHLWVLLCGLGTLVCLSAPFLRDDDTRRQKLWFIAAAFFTAFGLWISAPSIALVLIGIFAGFLFVPQEAVRKVDSSNWRLFGTLAAALTLVACWWEFRPDITLNVETNNPVYAVGVLVAGIWFWQAHNFTASGRSRDSIEPRPLVYSALGMLLAALPILYYLPYCFSQADPFFSRWESQISEEQAVDIRGFMLDNALLSVALTAGYFGLASRKPRISSGVRAVLAMTAGLILTYGYFAISRNRFSDIFIVGLVVTLALAMPRNKGDRSGWLAAAFVALICFGAVHGSANATHRAEIFGAKQTSISYGLSMRETSDVILRLDPSAQSTVMAPSYEANSINYFTRMPVYGTAYWENSEGLKTTCRIFFFERPSDLDNWNQVRDMLVAKGVRLIFIPKDFSYQSSYMIYGNDRIEDPQFCFAYYLIQTDKDKLVPWLKLERDEKSYRIFSFNNSAPDASAGEGEGDRLSK